MIVTIFVTYFYISSILNEPDMILSMSSYIEHMNPHGFQSFDLGNRNDICVWGYLI